MSKDNVIITLNGKTYVLVDNPEDYEGTLQTTVIAKVDSGSDMKPSRLPLQMAVEDVKSKAKESFFINFCVSFFKGVSSMMTQLSKNFSQYHEDVKDQSFMDAQLPQEKTGSKK